MPPKNPYGNGPNRIDAPADSLSGCPPCTSEDPQTRSRHQLFLARQGLEVLRDHLYRSYGQSLPAPRRRQAIQDICAWVATVMKQYGGLAHPETGAPMPWWDSRARALATPETPDEREAAWKHQGLALRLPAHQVRPIIAEVVRASATTPWARGHLALIKAGLGGSGTYETTATICREFAQRWPQDGDAWEREAQWWQGGAVGPCPLTRQPGEEG